MHILSSFKAVIATSLSLLIISCNGKPKDKVKVTEVTLQDIKQEEKEIEPPPPPPPNTAISSEVKKCFTNDGLKYSTIVTLIFITKNGEEIVSGNVISEEMDSGKKEKGNFEGSIKGDQLLINFTGPRPMVGTASEWSDKPWTIKKAAGKETLLIIFNAKNYDTNKWEDTNYEFTMVDCK